MSEESGVCEGSGEVKWHRPGGHDINDGNDTRWINGDELTRMKSCIEKSIALFNLVEGKDGEERSD